MTTPGLGGPGGHDADSWSESVTSISPPRKFATTNRFVSWWSVHENVQPVLDAAREWPIAGTPAWCALPADDPRKLASLLDAAQHWVLRVETCQQAECEASRDVSAAANWAAVARNIVQRSGAYVPRKVS